MFTRPREHALDEHLRDAAATQLGRNPHPDEVRRRRIAPDEADDHALKRLAALLAESHLLGARRGALAPQLCGKRTRRLHRLEKSLRIRHECT
jgi:hypothetical protein